MTHLMGFQKKFLRGLAHKLQPIVYIGQKGVTRTVCAAFEEALNTHELIKVKFVENKEKTTKKEICVQLEQRANAALAGLIGHVAIFYRPHPNLEKRKIVLPQR